MGQFQTEAPGWCSLDDAYNANPESTARLQDRGWIAREKRIADARGAAELGP